MRGRWGGAPNGNGKCHAIDTISLRPPLSCGLAPLGGDTALSERVNSDERMAVAGSYGDRHQRPP